MSFIPFAHALASRQDLPIPAWLFAWAASIVLIVSFFALSAAWREPKLEDEHRRPLGERLSAVLLGLPLQIACGAVGVFLLGVAIYAGLEGTEAPDRNFALTFLFVTCWLGFPFFSAVFGDLFRPFNPWRAIGRAAGAGFTAIARQRPAHLSYPEKLGRWPAA
ncbi:MAG TPA: fenitrothion hydrolase, partial [Solirubrobacterales bacterium]|nr:fenitrothion hydrolase [Solirubrobacterales bacterium]